MEHICRGLSPRLTPTWRVDDPWVPRPQLPRCPRTFWSLKVMAGLHLKLLVQHPIRVRRLVPVVQEKKD